MDDSGTSLSFMQISLGRCVPDTPMVDSTRRSNTPIVALTQSLPPNIIHLIGTATISMYDAAHCRVPGKTSS